MADNVNERTLIRLFPNASRSVLAANVEYPELPGKRQEDRQDQDAGLRAELERTPRARTVGKAKAQEGHSGRFLVRVTSIRSRLLDEDNLCEKYVVDCCRYAGLLPGDGPGQTKIEARQRKAGKDEDEGTLIEIFQMKEEA